VDSFSKTLIICSPQDFNAGGKVSAVGPVEKVVWATAVVTHNRTSRKSKRAQPHWTPLTCCVSPAMPLQIFALVRSSPLKSSCNLASFATTDRGGGKRRLVGTVKQCPRNGPRRVEMNSRSSVIETSRRALTASATVSSHWPQPLRLGPDQFPRSSGHRDKFQLMSIV
jgi:hypothetical protein